MQCYIYFDTTIKYMELYGLALRAFLSLIGLIYDCQIIWLLRAFGNLVQYKDYKHYTIKTSGKRNKLHLHIIR